MIQIMGAIHKRTQSHQAIDQCRRSLQDCQQKDGLVVVGRRPVGLLVGCNDYYKGSLSPREPFLACLFAPPVNHFQRPRMIHHHGVFIRTRPIYSVVPTHITSLFSSSASDKTGSGELAIASCRSSCVVLRCSNEF